MILGDFNNCLLNQDTDYQQKFDVIHTDNFLLCGWALLVDDVTRFQPPFTQALLDHIYIIDMAFTSNSDHNLIGVQVRHDGPIMPTKFIERRDLDVLRFSRYFSTSDLWKIFNENDEDHAFEKLNSRIISILNLLTPKSKSRSEGTTSLG